MKRFEFDNILTAWESINELLIDTPRRVLRQYSGVRLSSATYLYDVTFTVNNPTMDMNFDFGRHFNYTKHKWNTLVSNYVPVKSLQDFKSEIDPMVNKKRQPFSAHMAFSNTHKNGKGCLMSLTVARRYSDNQLYITLYMRSSEVTKRLIFDLLLLKRLGDYLLGDQPYKMVFSIGQLFNDDGVLLMYHAHKDLKAMLEESNTPHANSLLKRLNKLLECKPSDIKYKVHLRAYKVLHPELYKYPQTLAKDCLLPDMY